MSWQINSQLRPNGKKKNSSLLSTNSRIYFKKQLQTTPKSIILILKMKQSDDSVQKNFNKKKQFVKPRSIRLSRFRKYSKKGLLNIKESEMIFTFTSKNPIECSILSRSKMTLKPIFQRLNLQNLLKERLKQVKCYTNSILEEEDIIFFITLLIVLKLFHSENIYYQEKDSGPIVYGPRRNFSPFLFRFLRNILFIIRFWLPY